MKKKGLHCCGFRCQHTYNGKLIKGRGNFVCISTIYDLYFLWVWIGPFSRGSNRTCTYPVHECTGRYVVLIYVCVFIKVYTPCVEKRFCVLHVQYMYVHEIVCMYVCHVVHVCHVVVCSMNVCTYMYVMYVWLDPRKN